MWYKKATVKIQAAWLFLLLPALASGMGNPYKKYEPEPPKIEAPPPSAPKPPVETPAAVPALPPTGESAESFLATKDWTYDGEILEMKEAKIITAQGDYVYVSVGRLNGAAPKARYDIYRRGKAVVHPTSGDFLGNDTNRVGVLELTKDVADKNSTAIVVMSRQPIQVGDLIKRQPVNPAHATPPPAGPSGGATAP